MLRAATNSDIDTLCDLGARMASESPEWSGMGYSAEKVGAMLRSLIGSPRGFVMVAERDGRVCGGMIAAASEHWGCDCLIAFELALYVEPGSRGAVTGLQLIKSYREWVMRIGARRGMAGVTTGIHTERTAVIYERAGARRLGVLFDVVGGA